jgi:hypothetical protein
MYPCIRNKTPLFLRSKDLNTVEEPGDDVPLGANQLVDGSLPAAFPVAG